MVTIGGVGDLATGGEGAAGGGGGAAGGRFAPLARGIFLGGKIPEANPGSGGGTGGVGSDER